MNRGLCLHIPKLVLLSVDLIARLNIHLPRLHHHLRVHHVLLPWLNKHGLSWLNIDGLSWLSIDRLSRLDRIWSCLIIDLPNRSRVLLELLLRVKNLSTLVEVVIFVFLNRLAEVLEVLLADEPWIQDCSQNKDGYQDPESVLCHVPAVVVPVHGQGGDPERVLQDHDRVDVLYGAVALSLLFGKLSAIARHVATTTRLFR